MRASVTVALAVLLVAGCAGGDPGSVPITALVPAPAPTAGGPAAPMRVLEHRSTGTGRALAAVASGSEAVVVTAAGVYTSSFEQTPAVQLDTFTEPVGFVDVAVSPDGATAAVLVGHPAAARIYDLAAGSLVHTIPLADGQVSAVAFAPDGTLIAQGPTALLAWPAGIGTAPVALAEGTPLGRAALLPDGRVVAGLADSPDVLTGPLTGPLERTPISGLGAGTLTDAKSTPSGRLAFAVAGGPDEFSRQDDIVVVDPTTWSVTATIATGTRTTGASWALSDAAVAVAGPDGTAAHGLDGQPLGATPGAATAVAAAPDGFATLGPDGVVSFWAAADLGAPRATATAPPHVGSLRSAGGTLATVGSDGDLAVWDATSGAPLLVTGEFATGELTGVAVSPDGAVATSSSAGRARVYDAELRPTGVVDEDGRRIDAVAFVPGSHDMITALAARVGDFAFDDSVARWNGTDLAEGFRIAGDGADVAGCAFFYNRVRVSPDGSLVATVKHSFDVQLVDPASGAIAATLPPHGATVFDIAFDDAGHLISAADDASVRVWNVADASLAADYPSTPGGYTSVTPLGDGTMAVTGLIGDITIVDVLTGAVLSSLPVTATRTGRPAASPDGTVLAVPADDGSVGVWSIAEQRELVRLAGPAAPVSELVFASATALFGASQDGTLHAWTLGG